MLRDSDDPVLAIARRSSVSDTRQGHPDPTHVVFDNQLLGNVLEVPLAHFLESISDVLLDEFFRFRYFLFGIAFSRTPNGGFQRLWRSDSQVRPGVGLEESGQKRQRGERGVTR